MEEEMREDAIIIQCIWIMYYLYECYKKTTRTTPYFIGFARNDELIHFP